VGSQQVLAHVDLGLQGCVRHDVQALAHLGGFASDEQQFGGAGLQVSGGQGLPQVIMQLAGQVLALVMNGQRPLLLQEPGLSAFLLGYVAQHQQATNVQPAPVFEMQEGKGVMTELRPCLQVDLDFTFRRDRPSACPNKRVAALG
jgi:hypothetical protein